MPLVKTPVLTTEIKENCFGTANPIGCCTTFVQTLAVSSDLTSQGQFSSCGRGSTVLNMQFTAEGNS